jgi:hypothetical protein
MVAYYFLSKEEALFFQILCETVVPEGTDAKSDPGAVTVGGVSYIDSFLVSLPKPAREYLRNAVRALDEECQKKFSRKFVDLQVSERDEILREFYLDSKTRERMFDLRSLALEAFYSDYHDPSYDGITAWQYVEFGGKRISDIKKDWTFLKVWKDYDEENKSATSSER